jgi:hypothetical protein
MFSKMGARVLQVAVKLLQGVAKERGEDRVAELILILKGHINLQTNNIIDKIHHRHH